MVTGTGDGATTRGDSGGGLSAEERGFTEARALVAEQLRAAARLAGVHAVLAPARQSFEGAGGSYVADRAGAIADAGVGAGAHFDGWGVGADGTVMVSPDRFLASGDSPREAAYAVLVELWGVVREARRAPRVVARRRALSAANPALGLLLAGLVRSAAVWELTTALPGLSATGEVRAARVIAEAGPMPRHLQLVAELTRAAFSGGADVTAARTTAARAAATGTEIDVDVRAELAALRDFEGVGDAIRALLAPDPTVLPGERLDRQLAVIAPAYFRLLELDAHDRGALGNSSQPIADADDRAPDADELAPGHGGDEAQRADPAGDAAEDAPTVAADPGSEPDDDADPDTEATPEQPAAERASPPPADLFQLDRDAFVTSVLDSPMSASDNLIELLLEQSELERAQQDASNQDPAGARARDALLRKQTGAGLAAHERYAERVRAWADPIDRTRELWRRVIDERITVRRALGRRAHPDGEVLSPWALARAVIDAQAGVATPDAFARYGDRVRVGQASGRTDYVFVVDRSGSMQGRSAQAASDAVLVLLEALAGAARDIRDAESRIDRELDLELRTALFVYDAEPLCLKPLSAGLDDEIRVRLDTEIRRVGGSTNDAAALDAVGAAFTDPARRRIAIVVSDGGTNDDTAAYRALVRLRAAGVTVWGIGVGSVAVALRYAPFSRRVDHPAQLVPAIQDLIEELT